MAPISIGFGVVLIVVGVVSFVITAGEKVHYTALIPVVFGLLLVVLGLLALKESLRKHAMHLAAMVGAVGFIVPAVRLLLNGASMVQAALVEHLIMAVVCLLFVALCVRSFIVARRNRARQVAP